MNYICFMFQTAIVSAGLFFSRKLIYTLYNSKTAAFFTTFPSTYRSQHRISVT